MPQMIFPAINYDRNAKANAELQAREMAYFTGKRYVVEYRDHYDDTRVSGEYVVREAR
jgi:hypothetical protein